MIALPAAASARQPMSPTLPSSRSRRVQHRPSRPLPPGTHARSPRGNHAATTRQHCGYGADWQPLQRQSSPKGTGADRGSPERAGGNGSGRLSQHLPHAAPRSVQAAPQNRPRAVGSPSHNMAYGPQHRNIATRNNARGSHTWRTHAAYTWHASAARPRPPEHARTTERCSMPTDGIERQDFCVRVRARTRAHRLTARQHDSIRWVGALRSVADYLTYGAAR